MVYNEEILKNDLLILAKNFYKVIEIDLNEDTYFEVKIGAGEPHIYSGVRKWADAFVKAGQVYDDDVDRFLAFFDLGYLKSDCRKVFYRRRIGEEWRWVCMETLRLDNYSDDDAIVLLIVTDVEDYIKEWRQNKNDD